jgi:hypothetical protein
MSKSQDDSVHQRLNTGDSAYEVGCPPVQGPLSVAKSTSLCHQLPSKWKSYQPEIKTQSRKKICAEVSISLQSKHSKERGYHQNSKHLGHQPSIPTNSAPVFEQFSLRALNIIHHIFCVGVYPLYHLALF